MFFIIVLILLGFIFWKLHMYLESLDPDLQKIKYLEQLKKRGVHKSEFLDFENTYIHGISFYSIIGDDSDKFYAYIDHSVAISLNEFPYSGVVLIFRNEGEVPEKLTLKGVEFENVNYTFTSGSLIERFIGVVDLTKENFSKASPEDLNDLIDNIKLVYSVYSTFLNVFKGMSKSEVENLNKEEADKYAGLFLDECQNFQLIIDKAIYEEEERKQEERKQEERKQEERKQKERKQKERKQEEKKKTTYNRSSNYAGSLNFYFKILELDYSENITKKQIKAQYRQLSKRYHPDSPTGNANHFIKIKNAYDYIIDNDLVK